MCIRDSGITELCLGLKAIDKVKIPASTSIGLLALSESCKILGDAMKKFGNMSWSEIGHGLTGMGGALTELVIALKALNGISCLLYTSILQGPYKECFNMLENKFQSNLIKELKKEFPG